MMDKNKTANVNIVAFEAGGEWRVAVHVPTANLARPLGCWEAFALANALERKPVQNLDMLLLAEDLRDVLELTIVPEVAVQVRRLGEMADHANRLMIEGAKENETECACVLPEQSCSACRAAGRHAAELEAFDF